MKISKSVFGGASAIVLAATGMPMTAAAQQAASDQPTLDTVVVTARRVEENQQTVPVAVTTLNATALEERGITSVLDLTRVSPNVVVREGPQDPTSAYIVIRGQSQPDTLLTNDMAVGLYVDGVNYPRAFGMRANMIDVQRVEILRGPQGTLYGKNTTGGAMSIITRDPTEELGGSIKLTAGNYETYGATGVLNLPITEGVGLRVVGAFGERDEGFGHNVTGWEFGTESSRFIRGKLKIEPSDDLSIVLSADYQRHNSGGMTVKLGGVVAPGLGAISYGLSKGILTAAQAGFVPGTPANGAAIAAAAAAMTAEAGGGGRFDNNGTFDSGSKFEAGGAAVNVDWDFTDHYSARSITSYRSYSRGSFYDFDMTNVTVLHPNTVTPVDQNFTQELQLLGNWDKFNFVLGAFYSDEEGKDGSKTINLAAITANALNLQDATINSTSSSIFGQATWHFADDWSLTGGARYTSEDKSMTTRNRNRTPAGVVTCNVPVALRDDGVNCAGTLNVEFNEPTWLASLDHTFSGGSLVYGKVSRGFRGGGHNLRGSSTVASFQPFAPELVTSYETGFKTEVFDRRLRFNAAAFFDKLEGIQRSIVVLIPANNSTATVTTNAASGRIWGVEGEALFRPTEALTLSAAVGYNNAEYETFVDFTGDRSNEEFPVPHWQTSVAATYTIPTSFGSVDASADVYYQSDLNLIPTSKRPNEAIQPGYALTNARLTAHLDASNIDVSIFGKNLTDEEFNATAVGLEALGYNIVFQGEPRTFGVEISKRFGGERN